MGGLQQIGQYVFKRQRVSVAVQRDSQAVAPPQSYTLTTSSPQLGNAHEVPLANTHLGRQDPPVQASTHARQEGDRESQLSATQCTTSNSADPVYSTLSQNFSFDASEPRRFHLSRTGAMQFAQSAAVMRSQKAPIAVFVEKKNVSRPLQTTANATVSKGLSTSEPPVNSMLRLTVATPYVEPLDPNPPAPLRNVKMPSGKTVPWDVRPDELAAEMEAYILGEIGRNIAEPTLLPAESTKKSLRFKPRACAGRLRQPGRAPVLEQENSVDIVMTDATEEPDNNSSYIIDTYVRMPAEMFPSDRQTQKVGLLVLETQPDIDEFYNDNSDQESETYCEEDEDENGESFPLSCSGPP